MPRVDGGAVCGGGDAKCGGSRGIDAAAVSAAAGGGGAAGAAAAAAAAAPWRRWTVQRYQSPTRACSSGRESPCGAAPVVAQMAAAARSSSAGGSAGAGSSCGCTAAAPRAS